MRRENSVDWVLKSKIKTSLLLLALRQKYLGIKDFGIVDYHRSLKNLFGFEINYWNCRLNLERLHEKGLLKKDLAEAIVRNDIINSESNIRIERTTKVYKRLYLPNYRNRDLRRILFRLNYLSKRLLKRNLVEVLISSVLLTRFCYYLRFR
jgi:hypothetical protein